ncbi:MAG: tRNA lysidine(34) synthetase TilS [Oscillospiraceae bacterium]
MDSKRFSAETKAILSQVPEKGRILAALSGGADSVCLLLVLNEYCCEKNITLSAIHINHCLRGEESDRDEQFCRELCMKYDIPLTVKRINVSAYCEEKGLSCEEGARILRYEAFDEAAQGGYIATAHNLNDSAETVILNLARGTGLKGLCGIPPVRGNIIRPLINIPRCDIEEYLSEKGQPYVTDSTNLTDDFNRNKIRHGILPILSEINGGFLENIGNMTRILRSENEHIEKEAAALTGDIEALRSADEAVRRRYIIGLLKNAGVEPDSGRITRTESVILRGGRQQLSGNVFAYSENDRLIVGEMPETHAFSDFSAPLIIGENPFPPDRTILAEKINFYNLNDINSFVTNALIDCDKIQGDVTLRTRRGGDEIQLPKEGFHRKLRKIYNAEKIPPHLRECAAVIEDEGGIIFAEYCGVSARVAPDENTRCVLRISTTDTAYF